MAVACLAVAIVPAVWRGRSAAARWALLAFAAAGIGANPTDFAFLVVLAIAWAAFAAPRERQLQRRKTLTLANVASVRDARHARGHRSGLRLHDGRLLRLRGCRSSVRVGDLRSAEAGLTTAVALDPGMALYARQRGTVRLLLGDLPAATRDDLERAARLNPSDDLAWRTLALARAEAGSVDAAMAPQPHRR